MRRKKGPMMIERAFVNLASRQLHIRRLHSTSPSGEAMFLFHASPASA
jgi:hypothetical protein